MWKKFGRNTFYDELKGMWNMDSAYYLAMCLGNLNGHMGRHIDGFVVYGVSQRNFEGTML